MSVYLTGSEGFIGKNISKKIKPDFEFDLIKKNHNDIFKAKFNSGDLIIHNGAISSTRAKNIQSVFDLNVNYTQKLMNKCYESGSKLIYASSASVYGKGNFGFSEDSNMSPRNLYAKSKMISDVIAEEYLNRGAKFIGLRYFNVYGPGDQYKKDMASVIAKFYSQSVERGVVTLFEGSDKIYRDFIYVDDVVDIINKLSKGDDYGVYNCGTGTERSFMDIANIISKRYSSKIKEIPMPKDLVSGYQFFTKSDNEKLSKYIKHDYITLEEGVSFYLDYLEGLGERVIYT